MYFLQWINLKKFSNIEWFWEWPKQSQIFNELQLIYKTKTHKNEIYKINIFLFIASKNVGVFQIADSHTKPTHIILEKYEKYDLSD